MEHREWPAFPSALRNSPKAPSTTTQKTSRPSAQLRVPSVDVPRILKEGWGMLASRFSPSRSARAVRQARHTLSPTKCRGTMAGRTPQSTHLSASGKSSSEFLKHGTSIGPYWVLEELRIPRGPGLRRVRSMEVERQRVPLRSGRYGISTSDLISGFAEQQFAVHSERYALSRSKPFEGQSEMQPTAGAVRDRVSGSGLTGGQSHPRELALRVGGYPARRNVPFNGQPEPGPAFADVSSYMGRDAWRKL